MDPRVRKSTPEIQGILIAAKAYLEEFRKRAGKRAAEKSLHEGKKAKWREQSARRYSRKKEHV
jgi:hypothetical protein